MLSYERANELLRYDPDTGKLYWQVRTTHRIRIGDEAGTLVRDTTNTYRQVRIDRRTYLTHRIAWLLHYKVWPDGEIDHKDGDGLNNRIENLRDVPHHENMRNMRMPRSNTSGVTGVYWDKWCGKWKAQIMTDGRKNKNLGRFDSIDEAAEAYRKAADEIGFTERHGGER